MAEYKLGTQYLEDLRKATLLRIVPMALAAGGVGIFMGTGGTAAQGVLFWLILIPLFGGSLGYGLYRGLQQQKRAAESYRFYMEADLIRRVQDGLSEAVISRGSIVKILEAEGKGMTVCPVSGPRIHIPAALTGYGEVRARLAQWHGFEDVPGNRIFRNQAVNYFLMAMTLGLFWTTFSSHEARTVLVAGSVLFLFVAGCTVFVFWSQEVPASSKKAAWVGLIALASIALRVWMAFQGWAP